LGVAGIDNVIQRTSHVVYALGGTRTCAGHHRQSSDQPSGPNQTKGLEYAKFLALLLNEHSPSGQSSFL
jgi:hypothetical protein